MPIIPDKDHDRLIAGWQRWRITLAEAMDTVHDALEIRDYVTANDLMANITQQQAKISVVMTNVLIRNGIIKGDASDDE